MNQLIIVCWLLWPRTVFFTIQHAYKYHKLWEDNPIDVPHSNYWGDMSHVPPRNRRPCESEDRSRRLEVTLATRVKHDCSAVDWSVRQFEGDALWYAQPLKTDERGRNMLWSSDSEDEPCSSVLDRLEALNDAGRKSKQNAVTIVQSRKYECLTVCSYTHTGCLCYVFTDQWFK